MKKFTKALGRYPSLIVFSLFLAVFSLAGIFMPDTVFSDMENRNLQQTPAFGIKELTSGTWFTKFSAYLQDQFPLRNQLIGAESFTNSALLQKTEEGDILYGKDRWMFTKLFHTSASTQARLDKNTAALAQFAGAHPDKVTFLLAPSASNIYAEELPAGAPMVDENAMMDGIFSAVGDSAQVVDLRQPFSTNKATQLYYKTDHHWTTDGAYLAYTQFCNLNGLTPFDVATHQGETVPGFYGTHYSTTHMWNVQPDTIKWYPLPNLMMVYTASGETEFTQSKIGTTVNTEKFATRDKYGAFLDGNNGYTVINGDGEGSILVIKDSYANAFVPFLTANYAKIGVVDFRMYGFGPDALIEKEGYDKVLVLYNFQTFIGDTDFINIIRPAAQ